jgi:hypothetical protein
VEIGVSLAARQGRIQGLSVLHIRGTGTVQKIGGLFGLRVLEDPYGLSGVADEKVIKPDLEMVKGGRKSGGTAVKLTGKRTVEQLALRPRPNSEKREPTVRRDSP